MKLPILIAVFLTTALMNAQYVENTPWMKSLVKEKGSKSAKSSTYGYPIHEIGNAFDEYWANSKYDPNKKGSGFKQFKRWENYWKNFADEDGYIPTAKMQWEVWTEKTANKNAVNPISNWTSIGPNRPGTLAGGLPGTGRINAIEVDPNDETIWYAGAPAGGIWKSMDSGTSWTNLFDDFPQIGVSGIAIDPNNSNIIYIATGDDDASDSFSVGVFKSVDGGLTWNQTGLNPSNQNEFDTLNEIVVDPTDSNRIWVAGTDGLQLSEDGGDTWSIKLNRNVTDFKLKPGNPEVIYAVDPDTYYKSDNGGENFSAITDILPTNGGRMVLGVSPADPNILYILAADTIANGSSYLGLFKSTDSGETFIESPNTEDIFESNQAWFDLAIEVSPTDAEIVFTGVLNIWKSTNGGNSFSQLNQWFSNTPSYTHADIHTLKFFGEKLFCGSDGGLYVSEDNGTTFEDFTGNMSISQFYRISTAKNNANRIVGGTQDNSGYIYNGADWNVYTGGDGMDYEIDPTNPNIAYGFSQFGGVLFITTDVGQNITGIGAPSNGTNAIQGNWITPLAIDSKGTVYSAFGAVYRLDGTTWTRISDFITGDNIDDLEIDQNNSAIMYLAEAGGLYRSQDSGVTFKLIETFDSQISDIAINNNNSNIVYVTTSSRVGVRQADQPSERGVHKITTAGNALVSNENITFNLPTDQAFFSIIHQSRDSRNPIYVGTSLGVYRFDDTLTEWENYFTNLPNVAIGDLEISPDDKTIVASTYGRGVWQSPIPFEAVENDIKLVSISPSPNTVICGEIIPEVIVENTGTEPIDQVQIVYKLNDNVQKNVSLDVSIDSGETSNLILPSLIIDEFSNTQLTVTVTIENDAFDDNNTQVTSFFPNGYGFGDVVFNFDDAENSLPSFNLTGQETVWERGIPIGPLLNEASSGAQVYATNLDGEHPNGTKAVILSKCYDLSTITAPILKFDMAYDLELNFDVLYVEYSIDNGSNWSVLGEQGSEPNWYSSNRTNESSGSADDCQNCPGAQWTGTNATMTEYAYDFAMNAARGELDLTGENSIVFRIVFHSDPAVVQEGVVIDDFRIEGIQTDDDDDNDGVLNINDNCPLISNSGQDDLDQDGIGDFCDLDDDGDDILDLEDNCRLLSNPNQMDYDGDGIGDLCDSDIDNDGISNELDMCNNTPLGAVVDFDGCEIFSLSPENFVVKTTGESCTDSNNGSVEITASASLNYTAKLMDASMVIEETEFLDFVSFSNIQAGTYNLCVTVASEPEFEQCFEITIQEPESLNVSSKIGSLDNEIIFNLEGGSIYFIDINGEITTTTNNQINIPLTQTENLISIKTDKNCQGEYKETVILSSKAYIYPNPVTNSEITIYLGANSEEDSAKLWLFDIAGNNIMHKSVKINNKKLNLDVSGLPNGVYILNVKHGKRFINHKILKK